MFKNRPKPQTASEVPPQGAGASPKENQASAKPSAWARPRRAAATNLQGKLNEGFAEARAWVGSLLRMRQEEFDAWILLEDPQKANVSNVWWGQQPALNVWGDETIVSLLQSGQSVEGVERAKLTQRIIGTYTLMYECEEWEKAHGPIKNSKSLSGNS